MSIVNGGYVTRKAKFYIVGVRYPASAELPNGGSMEDGAYAKSRSEAWTYFSRQHKGGRLFSLKGEDEMSLNDLERWGLRTPMQRPVDYSVLDLY